MNEMYPHLVLALSNNFVQKKGRGGGYKNTNKDEKFYKTQIQKLNSISEAYSKSKEEYKQYFEPNLIFKIKLSDPVSDEYFRKDLERAGIRVISSAPSKEGYWVAFTDEPEFEKFQQKLKDRPSKKNPTFVDVIEDIGEIPLKEKLSRSLQENGLKENTFEYLDVEIWKMPSDKYEKFEKGLYKLVKDNQGDFLDTMTTVSFHLIKIKCNRHLFLKIAGMREVARVDRPLQINIESEMGANIEDLQIGNAPNKEKPGILIVDSGISEHPLLKSAIADRTVLPSANNEVREGFDIDDAGHGTLVAGIALYGDVGKCLGDRKFKPSIWLYSAKVMYKADDEDRAIFDEKSLLENQLKKSIEWCVEEHPRCRIVNISFGDSERRMVKGKRQFRIASLIDELSFKYSDILFTIAAGTNDMIGYDEFPLYLTKDTEEVKIIDPATSAYGITVGSIADFKDKKTVYSNCPSPFTSTGPGLQKMIKPELVDYGGSHNDLVTVNPKWFDEGRLFTATHGTSYSAPKIAHYLARLKDEFPNASRNRLKALLLSSASIPLGCEVLGHVDWNAIDENVLNVYGYGRPNLDHSFYSESNRVLMVYDGEMSLGTINLFEINLPEEFLSKCGKRTIEVTLVFDPPTDSNRKEYLGVKMEYHLFRNLNIGKVQNYYEEIELDKNNDVVPEKIKSKEIIMQPKISLIKKGIHQKSSRTYIRKPSIDTDKPLVLAIICRKNWYNKEDYKQLYSVIVSFRHEHEIDLYNKIRIRNIARAKIRQ